MTTIGNLLAVVGAMNLGLRAPTDLSLAVRIEEVVGELESLRACQGQWGDQIDQPVYRETATRVTDSLRAVTEIISPDAVDGIHQALAGPLASSTSGSERRAAGSGDAARAVSALVETIAPLRVMMARVREEGEAASRERLETMNRIVNGGEPVAGLPDLRSTPSLHPTVPEWARTLQYRVGGEERTVELNHLGYASLRQGRYGDQVNVVFQHGRFWIDDPRDASLWDLRNWAGRLFGGVFAGRDGNIRLEAHVRWPVVSGDQVRLGRSGDVELLLPRTPILESIKGRILAARNFDELSTLLRANGLVEIVTQINRYLRSGDPFVNIPHEGGLSLKIQELALRNEFSRVHRRYLDGLPEDLAMRMLSSLAVAIQDASSAEELQEVMRTTVVPGSTALLRGALLFLSKKKGASLDDVPEVLGLRARVQMFSSRADRELRGQVARLTGELDGIRRQLSAVRATLQEKTAALGEAERAAREAGARLEAARREWEDASSRARAEREGEIGRHRVELERRQRAFDELTAQKVAADAEVETLRLGVSEAEAERGRFQADAMRMGDLKSAAEAELEEVREAARDGIAERDHRIEELERNLAELRERHGETVDENMQLGVSIAELERLLAAARAAIPAAAPVLFGGADPRTDEVMVPVRGESTLVNPQGKLIGGASIVAGGEEGTTTLTLEDGSILSAKTTTGISKSRPPKQEDGYYTARFNLPDGTPVKIMVAADGAGGMGSGDVASSAFLQGIHARVVEMTTQGATEILAGDLAASGVQAVQKQKELGVAGREATGSCAVIVVVGNQATIATAADATVLYSKAMPDGSRRVVSYSDADYMEMAGQKAITAGIHKIEDFNYYVVPDVGDGDSFTTGSDGFHENVHPDEYKIQVSPRMRDNAPLVRGEHLPPPTRVTFLTIERMLNAVAGRDDAAVLLHDAAFEVMGQHRRPKGASEPVKFHLLGQEMQTTAKPGRDNIVVGHLQHARNGSAARPAPTGYKPLPEVVKIMQAPDRFQEIYLAFPPTQRPKAGDYLLIGRDPKSDGVVSHKTVSRKHAHLVYNGAANGSFLANTWYYQPIADNPMGDLHNGDAVPRNDWIALAAGDRLRMGGFPLVVSVAADGTIGFATDNPSPPPSSS